MDTAKIIYDYAKNKNDAGDNFPIVGICQGFQVMAMLEAEDPFVLEDVIKANVNFHMDFVEGAENSRMF